MFRRHWFDLHATVLHAEHALARAAHHLTQPVAVEPALILRDGPSPLLASNGIPILAATPPVPAIHADTITDDTTRVTDADADANGSLDTTTANAGTSAATTSAVRSVRLPLRARSALTAEPLRDVLRRGAHAGHAWFTVDIDPAGLRTIATHTVRDSAPPSSATWRDALISHSLQGQYWGQTCPGYQVHGGAPARFRTEVMHQLLADMLCSHNPDRVVTTVFEDSQPWLVDDLGDRTPVTADADGWWPITHPQLPWTANLTAETGLEVFEPHGADGASLRCGVCGAVDEVTFRELPSMAGYGLDTATTCAICGSWDGSDPIFGQRAHPQPWPPQPGEPSRGAGSGGREAVGVIDDDYTLDEGRDTMPDGWWRLSGRIPLTVRVQRSDIPHLPLVAFGSQFSGGVLSVYGPRYLDLGHFTRWDATRPWQRTAERTAYDALRDAHPDTFSTVIDGDGPTAVWLMLRLTRLTDPVTDTLLAVHDRTCPAGAHR